MSLSQAVKLARVELAGLSGRQKLDRFGQIVHLFASEVAGTLALAPFALKASSVYKALRSPSDRLAEDVCLIKGIRYGSRPRNTIDLYLPLEAVQGTPDKQRVPVVLFVHGGVWAAGESWHYAPLAASLARLGIMACVMQYTLYPDALVPQLVQEVDAAFDWAMENVEAYGGDAQQLSLVGHSAGAHLCMLALLQRAEAAHRSAAAAEDGTLQQQQQLPQMPQQFVGITGVYDIAKHYAYERDRGVHTLSTMLPVMGGFQHFAAQSPSVILAAALQTQQSTVQQHLHQEQQQPQLLVPGQQQPQLLVPGQQQEEPPACSFYSSFPLSGESTSHRIGFERGSDHYQASEVGLHLQSLQGMSQLQPFPLEAASHLPPVVLMSSCSDLTVPWFESAELYWRLFDCGVPVKHLVYNKVGHGDFVTNWPGNFCNTDAVGAPPIQAAGHGSATATGPNGVVDASGQCIFSTLQQHRRLQWVQQLAPYCRDLATVLMGQQPINFNKKVPEVPAQFGVSGSHSNSDGRQDGNLTAAGRGAVEQGLRTGPVSGLTAGAGADADACVLVPPVELN